MIYDDSAERFAIYDSRNMANFFMSPQMANNTPAYSQGLMLNGKDFLSDYKLHL